MIFKESTLKEMEYRYVKKNICCAESGFLYDRKYAHKYWKKRELDSTEFGLVSFGFSFAKNRDWRGTGL